MILIALGANLPDRQGTLPIFTVQNALECLDALPGLRLVRRSRFYRTAPIPASDQPDYVNAVAALETNPGAVTDPAKLLADLMAIEAAFGRRRGEANAARTLDLDIIAIDDTIREAPDPILPHPRAHLRRFVMAPLVDVAPDWVHPVLGDSATALLARLPPDGVTAMA